MDKLSQTVSRWWPSEEAMYEPIDVVDGDEALEESDEGGSIKAARFAMSEYLIFALLGMAMLWSWYAPSISHPVHRSKVHC